MTKPHFYPNSDLSLIFFFQLRSLTNRSSRITAQNASHTKLFEYIKRMKTDIRTSTPINTLSAPPTHPTALHIIPPTPPYIPACSIRLTRTTLEGLSEHEELDLVVDGQDTSASDTTEDVGTGTLEE